MLMPKTVLSVIRDQPPLPSAIAAVLLGAIALQLFLFARGGIPVAHAGDPAGVSALVGGLRREPEPADLARIGALFGSVAPGPSGSQASLVLTGTFVLGDASLGMAIVGESKELSRLYHVGAELPGGLTLSAVFADHIVVNRGGILETLRFPPLAPGEGGQPAVVAQQVASTQADSILGGMVRAVPVRRGKGMAGYLVYPTEESSAFREMGLRSGDLIVAINGTRLDDPKAAPGLVSTLSWASGVAVTVKRGGREKDLVLDAQGAAQTAQQERQIQEMTATAKDPVTRPYRRRGAAVDPATDP